MADKIPGSHHIEDGFSILSFGFVCMYLYREGDELVAFDTGMRPNSVRSELSKLSLDPVEVGHVFLTHTDRDHVGGLPVFPKAKVLMSEKEVAMITRKTPRFFGFVYSGPIGREYGTVSDGEDFVIGKTVIRCISTPGHTSGSMSFLINRSILVIGDEFNLDGGKAVLDRGMIAVNNPQRKESILKLARLTDVSLLCTMHSGYTRDFDGAMKEWRDAPTGE